MNAGFGVSKIGPGFRVGLDSAWWVAPWFAPTLRVNYGLGGLPLRSRRQMVTADGGVMFRIASGPGGSLMLGASAGYAYVSLLPDCPYDDCKAVVGLRNTHEFMATAVIGTIVAPRDADRIAISALFRLEVMSNSGIVPTISFGIGPRIRLANE